MVSNPPGSGQATARDCGGCNVCCATMHVPALDKPAGAVCNHQTPTGCGIYNERPEVCREWFCMWIRDHGKVFARHHRPDLLGVFFTASAPDPRTGAQTIYAHEVHPHAADTPEPQHVIQHLRQYAPVQIIPAPRHADATPLTHNGRAVA